MSSEWDAELRALAEKQQEGWQPNLAWVMERTQVIRKRRVTGILFVTLTCGAIVLATLLTRPWASQGSTRNRQPASGNESNYEFSDIRVRLLDDATARVTFDRNWTTSVYPGERVCTWTVRGDDGSVIGSKTQHSVALGASYDDIYQDVAIDPGSTPASADITCSSDRIDQPASGLTVSDVRLGSGLRGRAVLFTIATDDGKGQIGAARCAASAQNNEGEEIWNEDFNFYSDRRGAVAAERNVPDDIAPDASTAKVSCAPL